MPRAEWVLAAWILAALVLYALLAGADFGGGVWDLLAFGPRKSAQRALIEKALAPIWEANHVWLILAVVLLFSAFPPAFSAISIALHVPLALFLVGIVFRGSAFAFRAYELRGDRYQRRWGFLFSVSSAISPVLLGAVVGATASGRIRIVGQRVASGFFETWLAPFPISVGVFALMLFAFLGACYLAHEAEDQALREDFRRRAMVAGVLVGIMAWVTFGLSLTGAPHVAQGLTSRRWTWPFHIATASAATVAFWALWTRRHALARLAAAAQTGLIIIGWAASQYPFLIVPGLTVEGAAANPKTLSLLIVALVAGSVILFPALFMLYRVFKGPRAFALRE
jgi:cytochrome d ubiquinol oxidase subunit II